MLFFQKCMSGSTASSKVDFYFSEEADVMSKLPACHRSHFQKPSSPLQTKAATVGAVG